MKKWYFPASMLILAVFLFLFLFPGNLIDTRRILLGTQFSGMLTRAGPYFLPVFAVLFATMLFGRLYCAWLCPAGLLQHLFTHIGKRLGVARLGYRKPLPALSYAVMALVILYIVVTGCSLFLGPVPGFAILVQPLGEFFRHGYHRTARLLGENPAHAASVAVLLIVFVVLPLFRGRVFCNRVCPVGIVLGWVNCLPGQRFRIDADKCVSCGKCAKTCPVGCIDVPGKTIESSRCVDCWDCENACKFEAIRKERHSSPERRSFLNGAAMAGLGGLYVLARKVTNPGGFLARAGETPVAPPGSGGDDEHRLRCIACQACVPSCPVGILRPQPGRPVMDFTHGYCQYNCVECSRSCPAGAMAPLDLEEKHRTRLARVSFDVEQCVVLTKGEHCGACAEVCPTHAVSMVPMGGNAPTIPDFDPEYCIGCGGCYHVCPATPRAFKMEGLKQHERSKGIRILDHDDGRIEGEEPSEPTEGGLTDFPF